MVTLPRSARGLFAVVLLAACTRTPMPVVPGEVELVGEDVWLVVERSSGQPIRLRDLATDSATLRGTAPDGSLHRIAFDSIRAVELRRTDVTLLMALVPVAAVAIWLQHGAATAPEPPSSESCPFIYAWDGRRYVFQAEPYGGAIVPALERTEWTPLPQLRAVDGEYRLRIANELDETQHIDEARLVVVDHPEGTVAVADPYGTLFAVRDPAPALRASDAMGHDRTEALRDADRLAWQSRYAQMEGRVRETLRDPLVLEFAKPAGATTARLLVNGATSVWGAQVARDFLALRGTSLDDWYHRVAEGGPELAELVDWFAREGLYVVPIEVETPTGWEERGALYGSGPFVYKTTGYELDVADIPGDTLRVRLPVPVNFWVLNSVAVDFEDPAPVEIVEVETLTVRNGEGREVRALLSADDDRALVMSEQGDRVDLAYPAPPERPGMERTVFLKITGHYDIHLRADGAPDEVVLERMLREPGYTLRFAFERYLQTGRQPATGAR